MKIYPRHVLCVIGQWDDFRSVKAIVDQVSPGFVLDEEYSQLEPDRRMRDAFEASLDQNHPTLLSQDWRAIKSHAAVAYILSPPMKKSQAEATSAQALMLVARLLENGGVAAKSESAGLAHGRDHWLKRSKQYSDAIQNNDAHSASTALYSTWVQRAIHDADSLSFYSVGMHLLGHRDIEIDDDIEVSEAVNWIDLMGMYLVADKPSRAVRSGEGFRLSQQSSRRIIELDDCQRYAVDDFFYNPYGYIRLIDQ